MKKNCYIRHKIALRSQIELEKEQLLLDLQQKATRVTSNKIKKVQLDQDLQLMDVLYIFEVHFFLLNFIVLFPFLIKYYHIMFIIVVF